MSRPSLVLRLQGAVIAHTLASLVGCPHTGPGLARWCVGWRRDHHPTGPQPDDWAQMWNGYLRGRPLVQWYLAELQTDFPVLRHTLDNPLWAVLAALWEGHHPTDQPGFRLEFTREGQACMFPMHAASAMRRLCDCPDWRDLGVVLAILGSRSPRLSPHRHWLRKHVVTYLELVCLDEPGCYIREQLYELLDALNQRHNFGDLEHWPESFTRFEQGCEMWACEAARLGLCPSAHGWDLQSLALLSLLLAKQEGDRRENLGQAGASFLVAPTAQQRLRAQAVVKQHEAEHCHFVLPQWCDD